ncbi:MAG: hypothetical protein HY020_26580 [Burkholderiales bacterium]|nr:hypothetical protein [Burkholderiales bacterium]
MVRPGPIEGVEPEPAPDTPGFVSRQQNFLQVRGLDPDHVLTQAELARQRLTLLAEMRRRLDPPQEEPTA